MCSYANMERQVVKVSSDYFTHDKNNTLLKVSTRDTRFRTNNQSDPGLFAQAGPEDGWGNTIRSSQTVWFGHRTLTWRRKQELTTRETKWPVKIYGQSGPRLVQECVKDGRSVNAVGNLGQVQWFAMGCGLWRWPSIWVALVTGWQV